MEIDKRVRKPIPDGGYGWVILIASFFISFLIDGIMYTFSLLKTPIQNHFEATEEQAATITALNTGFLMCSGPIVAGLTNTFGCRAVIMVAGMITSVLYMMCAYASNVQLIWLFYGLLGGLSTGCAYISSLIVIAEYFDKKIGVATGIVMAGSGLGSAIMPKIMKFFIVQYDWKITISLLAAMLTLCSGLAALMRPLNPKSSKKTPSKILLADMDNIKPSTDQNPPIKVIQTFMGSVYSLHQEPQPFYKKNRFCLISLEVLKEMTNVKLLFQNGVFALCAFSNFFTFAGFFIPYLFIIRMAEDRTKIKNSEYLLQLIGILNVPFRLLYGFIADRRYLTPINLNTLCVFIATVAVVIYKDILSHHEWGQYMFASFFAMGTSGMNSLTTAYLMDIVGVDKFSNGTGIVNLFRGLGCFVGQYLGGVIADNFHYSYVFYFSGLCFTIGLAFTFLAGFSVTVKKCLNKNKKQETTVDQNNNDESGADSNLLKNHN